MNAGRCRGLAVRGCSGGAAAEAKIRAESAAGAFAGGLAGFAGPAASDFDANGAPLGARVACGRPTWFAPGATGRPGDSFGTAAEEPSDRPGAGRGAMHPSR